MSDAAANPKPAPARGGDLRMMEINRAFDTLYAPGRPKSVFATGRKLELYDLVAKVIGDRPLTYLEFGVHQGGSIHHIAKRFPDPMAKFVGFDSFEGLPESWGGLDPGHFSTHGTIPVARDSRISFVKGWFQDTAGEYLSTNPASGPVLVHFDADLYSSTLFLMSTIWHHIPEYYFLFDEYFPAEIVAMYDFARAYPIEFELFAALEDERHWPFQVFGRLKRVPFTLPPASAATA